MELAVSPAGAEPSVLIKHISTTNIIEIKTQINIMNEGAYQIRVYRLCWDVWAEGFHVKYAEIKDAFVIGPHTSSRIDLRESLSESEAADASWAHQKPGAHCSIEGSIFFDTPYGMNRKNFSIISLPLKFERDAVRPSTIDFIKDSYVDGLTGVLQRKFIEDNLQTILNRNQAFEPISLLMLDADDFKSVNDNFGHIAGDEVLKAIASVIKAVVSNRGFIIRYGGDEFCVILENCGLAEAKQLAEQILHEIKGSYVEVDAKRVEYAVSIGIASTTRRIPFKQLIQRADEMLLYSKRQGKNMISVDSRRASEE